MIFALVTGSLWRAPERRTAKTGRDYVTATIVSRDGESSAFANAIIFSDSAKDAILALGQGDALSVQGKATIDVYEKNGKHRPSLSIVGEHVLALRQPPKERKAPTSGYAFDGRRQHSEDFDGRSQHQAAPFDERIPFGDLP